MPSIRLRTSVPPHSTVPTGTLKSLAALLLAATACAQTADPGRDGTGLREEITKLVASGQLEQAIHRAQQALREAPHDPGVRQEYVSFHLALAQLWLRQHRYEACTAALEAILAVEPRHPQATRLQGEIRAARERAGQQAEEIDCLLRLELFEAALEQIRGVKALRPDLAEALRDGERAAWLGAADDHYLARNFNEAFALYENLLAGHPEAGAAIHSRWAVSLALALAESDSAEPTDPNAAGRLLARAKGVLRKTNEPVLWRIIGGLLAERAGHLTDAGRTYAEAIGEPWELPPADQRRARVRQLREHAVIRARGLYRETPVARREGVWAIALPEVWKHRRTPHFDVYARNDLIAARVAEAVEYHFAGIGTWLGLVREGTLAPAEEWEPRGEIRVHATLAELQQATGAKGITYAVSHTRLQGGRILLRKLHAFQADPWLLSSTLPHELTHLLIADAQRCEKGFSQQPDSRTSGQPGLPLAIDEGLALQAEPPSRRLMYRRLLDPRPPAPAALLAATQVPADVEGFYAEASALTTWLLHRAAQQAGAREELPPPAAGAAKGALHQRERLPVSELRHTFRAGAPGEWWRTFGLESEAELATAWSACYAARRAPHRMPLMILVEPAAEHRTGAAGDSRPSGQGG